MPRSSIAVTPSAASCCSTEREELRLEPRRRRRRPCSRRSSSARRTRASAPSRSNGATPIRRSPSRAVRICSCLPSWKWSSQTRCHAGVANGGGPGVCASSPAHSPQCGRTARRGSSTASRYRAPARGTPSASRRSCGSAPRVADVTIRLPGFFVPRCVMHRCSASMTTATPFGLRLHQRVRDLPCELLLELRPPRVALDEAGQLAHADDPAVRDVADGGDAMETA